VWTTLLLITARGWLKGEVTKSTSTLEVAIAESFAPILIYFVGNPLVMYLMGETGIIASLSDWALNCVVFITPLSAMVFDVAEEKMRCTMDLVDPELRAQTKFCPLHSLLVILSRLQSKDEFRQPTVAEKAASSPDTTWNTNINLDEESESESEWTSSSLEDEQEMGFE